MPTNDEDVLLFGLPVSTHRQPVGGDEGTLATTYFQYEAAIAALSILFFRTTVRKSSEHRLVSYLMGALLAWLAYSKESYQLITTVEIVSYVTSWVFVTKWLQGQPVAIKLLTLAASVPASFLFSGWLMQFLDTSSTDESSSASLGGFWTLMNHWLPVSELNEAYQIMVAFTQRDILHQQLAHLLFVSFHIQVGMGYLGIGFLTQEQSRRNLLIRMDVGDDAKDAQEAEGDRSSSQAKEARARRFQRGAGPFILFVAMPYMVQIIGFGNINRFAYTCLEHDFHRAVRLNELFSDDSNLAAMSLSESAASPDAYANSMTSVVDKAYEIFNRKLFSLPKIMLLPGVMLRQPLMMVQVFPFIFLTDWMKASLVSYMTSTIETLRKEIMEIQAVRTKVESFDLKNAELLQRSGAGATSFTQRRWEELTLRIQKRETVSNLIARSKAFFAFIQRNFVFNVLIDCSLATLMAAGKIVSAEIFVFSRAIEDAVDLVLVRSRSEAELAQMLTDAGKLRELVDLWSQHKHDKVLLPCEVTPSGQAPHLVLRDLHYSRGTASAKADHLELPAGIYALTGSNGSGKSTLFRVLMSCQSNHQPIELPPSIQLHSLLDGDGSNQKSEDKVCSYEVDAQTGESEETCVSQPKKPTLSITMPSSRVEEISQTFYWPLHSRPIEWIYQGQQRGTISATLDAKQARIVAEHLHSLEFFQPVPPEGVEEPTADQVQEATIQKIQSELLDEKEDWFGDLSGGQKSKVELVRKVFLSGTCPGLLLVDETMAPLDPTSKALVMSKLKEFCQESVVIVIYHTDVGREDSSATECVPSNNFFDHNLHLENGSVHIRPTC